MSNIDISRAHDFVKGLIATIQSAIGIYNAVQNKDDLTKRSKILQKVAEKLPAIELLLQEVEACFATRTIDEKAWSACGQTLQNPYHSCEDIHDVFQHTFQEFEPRSTRRLWKGHLTTSRKGRTLESLFREIFRELEVLMQRRILTNTRLLEDIKETVEEMAVTIDSNSSNNDAGVQNTNAHAIHFPQGTDRDYLQAVPNEHKADPYASVESAHPGMDFTAAELQTSNETNVGTFFSKIRSQLIRAMDSHGEHILLVLPWSVMEMMRTQYFSDSILLTDHLSSMVV